MSKEKAILEAYKTADYRTKVRLKEEFPDCFKLKLDTWYKTKESVHILKNSKARYVGFNPDGSWFDLPNFNPNFEDFEENEDLQDVYRLLMKEAVKRGLISKHYRYYNDLEFNFTTMDYIKVKDKFIFENGQWATTPNNINDLIDQLKEACEEEGFSVNVIIENENKL